MKKILFQLFVLFLVTFSFFSVSGQNDPLLRIELETKTDEANFRVIPCNENGLTLFYKTTLKENDYNFWIFILYNKFLQEAWKEDIPIFSSMVYRKYVKKGDKLYIFFYDDEKRKSEIYNFQVLLVHLEEQRYELFSGLLPDDGKIASFDVWNETVMVGMNFPDYKAGFYTFDLDRKEVKVLKEYSQAKARYENVYIDSVNQKARILFNVYNAKNDFYLQMLDYDTSMNPVDSMKFYAETGKKFNTGKIAILDDSRNLIFGTYDLTKNESVDDKDYFIREASGFFVVNFSNPDAITIRYENFLDLENMTGYLKSREYQQAKKKAAKNDEEGESVSLGYNLLLHDIIEHDSLFYFVGEGYYEDYHMVTNTYYDFYGRAMPVSYNVFDGYRYFNAFISCYDQQGKKLWDNGMEIFNIISFDLRKRVNVFFAGKETILAYNRDGKISAKIINGSETVEGVDHYPLETTYVNDKVMTDTKSNMEHWYDNYFVAYGFQTIRNNSLSNSKRTVFYINKVAFE